MAKKKKTVKRVSGKKRKQKVFLRFVACFACFLMAAPAMHIMKDRLEAGGQEAVLEDAQEEGKIPRPELDVELLTLNEYSRPGIALSSVNGIVIHYTGNPGTGAIANRNYFEGLKDSHVTKASSHFVIGLDGEIVQCIPCNEISYASNGRNADTISIECCIGDDTGKFNDRTYDTAVRLTAWLVERYHLTVSDVIRHYDVTGKECPKYFVEVPSAWEQFRTDVQAYLDRYHV